MKDQKTWNMLLKHLGKEDTNDEKEIFSKWLQKDEVNRAFFYKVKVLWTNENSVDESFKQNASLTFFRSFTKQKIKDFILKQAIGNLIGFMVGMWVTAMFSHHVLEKRGLKNLFGLTGRKKIVVNEIPEWLQKGLAILIGFIALELINYFFKTKKYLIIWEYMKVLYNRIKNEKS